MVMRLSLSTTRSVRPCTSSSSSCATPPPPPQEAFTLTKHSTTKTLQSCSLNMKPQSPTTLERLFVDSKNPSWLDPMMIIPSTTTNNSSTHPTKLSKNWMDYQGLKNWDGLLDPLDDNLRGEIIRYGHFVEAAYRAYDFDPSSSSYGSCVYPKRKLLRHAGFPTTGYRVTKNLVAASGIQLPDWIERGPSWMGIQSSWIGYVAVCQDKNEISRLGRRDVVIALRGTATCLEWVENLRATLTPLPCTGPGSDLDPDTGAMVESGFLSLYTSCQHGKPSLQKLVRDEIARVLKKYRGEPLSFTITGHSLGAALATLAAYDIKKTFLNSPLVTVISFAGPRVGNGSFRCHVEQQGTKILRIVNSDDLITKVPGFVVDNNENDDVVEHYASHSGSYTAAAASNLAGWVQRLVEDTQWVYADVGCELRLSSRGSPHLNAVDVAKCHELKTYLHLVNSLAGSNCPCRATARKLMNKAMVVNN